MEPFTTEILSGLVGALGAGLVTYITAINKITRLSEIVRSLRDELHLRNDALVRDLETKQAQLDNLKQKVNKHEDDIQNIRVSMASKF